MANPAYSGKVLQTKHDSGKTTVSSISKEAAFAGEVKRKWDDWSRQRQTRESVWLECWAHYLSSSPSAQDHLRSTVARTVGDVTTSWRHRITTSKGFEIVETITSYIVSALFPDRDWFDFKPLEPNLMEVAKLNKRFISNKLKQSQFRKYAELYIRQMLVTGFSVMALPWRQEEQSYTSRKPVTINGVTTYPPGTEKRLVYNNMDFEVLDVFDVVIDPMATDPNEAGMIRRIYKTKAEVLQLIEAKVYPHLKPQDVVEAPASSSNGDSFDKQQVATFMGIDFYPSTIVELYEYWGDITTGGVTYYDMCVTILGNKCAQAKTNPFWGGKPFVLGSCIPIPRHAYGLGVLEPVLGMLHQLSSVVNQRLDGLEVSINPMWEVVNDGVINMDDLYSEPGKFIEVGAPGNIRQLDVQSGFSLSYTEQQMMEQSIDKALGLGAYIGTQQGRNAERVTAAEIQAIRDAGGNRLAALHRHIEQTQILPLLTQVYRSCQQFVVADETVRLPSEVPNAYNYYKVGAAELQYEFDIECVGADHVTDKEYELNKLLTFVQTTYQIPEFKDRINWESLLTTMVNTFGIDPDVAETLIKPPAPPEAAMPSAPPGMPPEAGMPPQAPSSPEQEYVQAKEAVGGQPGAAAAMAAIAQGGVQGAAAQDVAMNNPLQNIDPNTGMPIQP